MKESILAQNLKIKVNTPSESERAQRAFFALGFTWPNLAQEVQFENETYLVAIADTDNYIRTPFMLFHTNDEDFCDSDAKWVELPELEEMAAQHKSSYYAETMDEIEQRIAETGYPESEGLNSFEIKTDGIYLRNGRHYHFEADKYDDFGEMICNSKGVVIKPISPADMVVLPPQTKEPEAQNLLLKFQAWQLENGYLDKSKVENGMVSKFLLCDSNESEQPNNQAEAQKRYEAAQKLLDECGFYASGDYSDTAYKAIRIAAGLE